MKCGTLALTLVLLLIGVHFIHETPLQLYPPPKKTRRSGTGRELFVLSKEGLFSLEADISPLGAHTYPGINCEGLREGEVLLGFKIPSVRLYRPGFEPGMVYYSGCESSYATMLVPPILGIRWPNRALPQLGDATAEKAKCEQTANGFEYSFEESVYLPYAICDHISLRQGNEG